MKTRKVTYREINVGDKLLMWDDLDDLKSILTVVDIVRYKTGWRRGAVRNIVMSGRILDYNTNLWNDQCDQLNWRRVVED